MDISRGPTLESIIEDRESALFDVVFVHGLGDGSWNAWRASNGFFWPESLAEEFADVQFWTLGYAAAMFWFSGSGMTLPDRASNLLQFFIDKGFGRRPVIFICHSLGGLVVKSLLRQSNTNGVGTLEPLAKCTQGVVFIATPHAGADLATVAKALGLAGSATKDLVAGSPWLREGETWYRNNAVTLSYATRAFAETEPTGLPPLGIPSVVVVNQTSADPGVAGTVCQPIDANHITICKPSSRDEPVYVGVKAFIKSCAQGIVASTDKAAPGPAIYSTQVKDPEHNDAVRDRIRARLKRVWGVIREALNSKKPYNPGTITHFLGSIKYFLNEIQKIYWEVDTFAAFTRHEHDLLREALDDCQLDTQKATRTANDPENWNPGECFRQSLAALEPVFRVVFGDEEIAAEIGALRNAEELRKNDVDPPK